jgi:CheY-like chemotaxis protein
MVQPQLVVIDDSEAILAFARAVLSSSYQVATATRGAEGLELCRRLSPQVVLLDLSMPEMDGETVLARLKSEIELEPIPVIIVSTEQARAEACLARGAYAYMVKPVRAEDMLAHVARALEANRTRAARGTVAVLPIGVGSLDIAVALAEVRHVLLQPATQPLLGGPSYLSAFFEHLGESVCVLDLAARFGVAHERPVLDRKLVIVEHAGAKLALCADRVRDPEEISPADVRPIAPESALQGDPELLGAVSALVRTSHGAMPVVRPMALLSRSLARSLPELVRRAGSS